MTDNIISSTQNPKIKRLLALQQKSSERRKAGLFVVEGCREVEHCLEAGYEVESLFVSEEFHSSCVPSCIPSCVPSCVPSVASGKPSTIANGQRSSTVASGQRSSTLFTGEAPCSSRYIVTPKVYEHIAYRGSTEGIVAIVKARHLTLDDLQLGPAPLIVVLESVEKPGNLGAILRSADAAGADAVIVCDPLTDLYNPNLIRSSIGAVFTVPTVACTSEACIAFLKARGIQILTAQLQDSLPYYDTPMTIPTALVMGTESTGLTQQWRQAATAHIRIPMLGRLDSLNVSVSTAILLYEAVRQRQAQ